MRRTDSRRIRLTLATFLSVALLGVAPAPAGGAAAPPRDTSRFACPATLPNPFTDIAGSGHEQAIRCMARYGFVNGTTSTTFSPHGEVTRGQLASFLARALAFSGVPLDPSDQGFTDITGSAHREAINALAELGVIHGTTATTFSPNRPVTRAQAASMVGRGLALGGPLAPGPDAFPDDSGSGHEASINALAAAGILGGVTADRFVPSGHLSRAAAASVLARAQDFAVETARSFPAGDLDSVLAALRGDAEVPGPGDAAARGTVELIKSEVDGLLCVTWDIDVGFTAAPVSAHVHEAVKGVAGPVLFALPAPRVAAGDLVFETSCAADLSQALIDEVFANPAGHYVNVHTDAFPDGAIRGQLGTVATPLGTILSGQEEAPLPGETMVVEGDIITFAEGDAIVDVLSDGTTICASVFYGGANTPTTAHIHKAAPGAAGPIVVTLSPFDEGDPISDGCIGGLAPAVVADIAANPDDHYINVHTDLHPDGAIRGQLAESALLAADLTGAAEVPGPGDPDGTGEASLDFIGDGVICLRLAVRGISTPRAAHIHDADAGAAGPIVVTLPTPVFNTTFGCVEVPAATFDALAANPSGFYVNVHNGAYPNGAIRGQLAAQAP
jgi:hypothetical protein